MILFEREREFSLIDQLVKEYLGVCIIGVGVNLVYPLRGYLPICNIKQYALQELHEAFSKVGVTITQYTNSGFIFLLAHSLDAQSIKRICCDIEEGNRLLDIDVYNANGCVSRLDIDLPERRCFLCGNAASWCIFHQEHSMQELVEFTLDMYKQMMDAHEK